MWTSAKLHILSQSLTVSTGLTSLDGLYYLMDRLLLTLNTLLQGPKSAVLPSFYFLGGTLPSLVQQIL